MIEDGKGAEAKIVATYSLLELTEDDFQRIKAFQGGVNGFPNRVPGGYGRMLYLSTVTVTTVGYGDVVPLTWQTRLLTGVEATLGIILLGLFVSSMVANRNPGKV